MRPLFLATAYFLIGQRGCSSRPGIDAFLRTYAESFNVAKPIVKVIAVDDQVFIIRFNVVNSPA